MITVCSPMTPTTTRITITDDNDVVIARWKVNADQMRLLQSLDILNLLNQKITYEPDYTFERI